jgi:Protein of unknown function (DUF433)
VLEVLRQLREVSRGGFRCLSQLSLENAVVSHVFEECELPSTTSLEYLAGGMTEAEILEDFSELTSEDIKACLTFAADREKKLFVASL